MIRISGLRRRMGEVQAVESVSFDAADGQITGLIGPNGAGKTTTLRMLTGLLSPDAGRILIDGVSLGDDRAAARRRMGVLPDARGLYKRLSARENIEYFGRLHGLSGKALAARVDLLLDALEMRDIEHRRAAGFSQGQRVKTATARALVHAPHNVILDEPTNGLDIMTTRAMRAFLRRLRDDGHCVLFSSHIMQEVTALCDRVVVIAQGRVVAEGTPRSLCQQTGQSSLEDAFISVIGSGEGLMS